MRIDLLFSLDVENLESSASCVTIRKPRCVDKRNVKLRTLESKNFLMRVHDSRVRRDWSTHDIVGISKVDNDDLVLFIDFFPNTNEVVGLESHVPFSIVARCRTWTGKWISAFCAEKVWLMVCPSA